MARSAEDLSADPVIVLINEGDHDGTLDEWRSALADDAPADVDAGAAEILREIREHGER
jgi:hypothetical protein